MGDCQNYGPSLGPYYNTGPNTGPSLGDPKRNHNFDNPPFRARDVELRAQGLNFRVFGFASHPFCELMRVLGLGFSGVGLKEPMHSELLAFAGSCHALINPPNNSPPPNMLRP